MLISADIVCESGNADELRQWKDNSDNEGG